MSAERKTGTREWSSVSVNCCDGCSNDCAYCYARAMALRFKRTTALSWRAERIRDKDVARSRPRYKGVVMFPTSHDLTLGNADACLTVLHKLLEAGNQVLLVSKPRLDIVKRVCREMERHRSRLLLRFTITARKAELLQHWEPNASGYMERLSCLMYAHGRDFRTSVSMEPMLDVPDAVNLFREVEPWVSETVWIGRMNRWSTNVRVRTETDRFMLDRLVSQQSDEHMLDLYDRLRRERKVRWKDSLASMLGLPRVKGG